MYAHASARVCECRRVRRARAPPPSARATDATAPPHSAEKPTKTRSHPGSDAAAAGERGAPSRPASCADELLPYEKTARGAPAAHMAPPARRQRARAGALWHDAVG